jgi:hypothetical protein
VFYFNFSSGIQGEFKQQHNGHHPRHPQNIISSGPVNFNLMQSTLDVFKPVDDVAWILSF